MASSAGPSPTSRTSHRRSPPLRSSRRRATSSSTSAATSTTASTSSHWRSSLPWTLPVAWSTGRRATRSSWPSPITPSSRASFPTRPPPPCPRFCATWHAGQRPAASGRAESSTASRSTRTCHRPGPPWWRTSRWAPARPAEENGTDILFVTPWFPYPATNGARVRSSKLLAGLAAAGHRCHLFAFEPPAGQGPYPDLASVAFTSSWSSRWPGRVKSTLALLARSPRYFRLIYQKSLLEEIRRVAQERRVDAVIAYELAAGDYVSRLDDGRFIKILDGCEPFAFQSPVDTIRSQARIWKFKHFLRQMLNGVDAYVAVSDAELRWIRDEVGPQRAWGCTVPNGAQLSAPFEGPADRSRVIYTGSLTYRP